MPGSLTASLTGMEDGCRYVAKLVAASEPRHRPALTHFVNARNCAHYPAIMCAVAITKPPFPIDVGGARQQLGGRSPGLDREALSPRDLAASRSTPWSATSTSIPATMPSLWIVPAGGCSQASISSPQRGRYPSWSIDRAHNSKRPETPASFLSRFFVRRSVARRNLSLTLPQ